METTTIAIIIIAIAFIIALALSFSKGYRKSKNDYGNFVKRTAYKKVAKIEPEVEELDEDEYNTTGDSGIFTQLSSITMGFVTLSIVLVIAVMILGQVEETLKEDPSYQYNNQTSPYLQSLSSIDNTMDMVAGFMPIMVIIFISMAMFGIMRVFR